MKRKRGFTLIELLVVVAIIALLIAILIPSLAKAREVAKRTVCATNLKSQGTAVAIYAAGNRDALPMFSGRVAGQPTGGNVMNGSGYWFHDEALDFGNTLLGVAQASQAQNMNSGSIRKWFYCPSQPSANATDSLWNYNGGASGYRAMGYAYLNDRTGKSNGYTDGNLPDLHGITEQPSAGNVHYLPGNDAGRCRGVLGDLQYHQQWISTDNPTETELALDEVMTLQHGAAGSGSTVPDKDFSEYANNNGVWGQYTTATPSATAHLSGNQCAGANVLAFDGHVAWRAFNKRKAATVPMGNPGNGDTVWYWVPSPTNN